MRRKQLYTPIIPRAKDWPLVQLDKQRRRFLQAVTDNAIQSLLSTHQTGDDLHILLQKTAEMELVRVQKKIWKADPSDDAIFWKQLCTMLSGPTKVALPVILRKIVKRYVQEITGRFRMVHYRVGQQAVTHVLGRLLNPSPLKSAKKFRSMHIRLQEKIQIMGAIHHLRELARIGTVVVVPTHFSHLDSLVMAWVTNALGLPHFVYGAGLNLFNSRFFAYFMNNLGTYKVDRRKKNLPYLATLKAYASLALQWGCHSLFYPGGTRSRSGSLEQQLKLGLLSTAFEAQQRNYQIQGRTARKIFVVPVVLSYHCVLEAPHLVQSYLSTQGLGDMQAYASRGLLKMARDLLTKDSDIFVSIGRAMDLLGNAVDKAGNSYDKQGRYIDSYREFCDKNTDSPPGRYPHEYPTKLLASAILRAYYYNNCVLTSHLVAFTSFALIKQRHTGLSLGDLLRLPLDKLIIPYVTLKRTFARLKDVILGLCKAGKIRVEPILKTEDLEVMILRGVHNLGLYHSRKPLLQNKTGDIVTQDLRVLWYYYNRLQGYALEAHVK